MITRIKKTLALAVLAKSNLLLKIRKSINEKWKDKWNNLRNILLTSVSYLIVFYIYTAYLDEHLSAFLKRIEETFITFIAAYLTKNSIVILITFLNKILPLAKILISFFILIKYVKRILNYLLIKTILLMLTSLSYLIILLKRPIVLVRDQCH